MRRRLLVVLATLVAAGCTAASALAAPPDDVRASADRFFAALAAGDSKTVCGALTSRTLAILGGADKCVATFGETAGDGDAEDAADAGDGLAQAILDHVFRDARALAVARDGYVTKQAKLGRFVRDLRTLEPELGFSIGNGPKAARGTSYRHVVVDRHTSARVLTLYVESESGTIWRLDAHGVSGSTIEKGGQGIPATPTPPVPTDPPQPEAPPTFSVTNVTLLDDVSAYATIGIQYEGKAFSYVLAMKLEDGSWKVDDVLIPVFGTLAAASGS